ncbi:DUF1810 domain-containing protein [Sphingomonas jatrophae]|uniref:Uncharacterized protein, DUF1810 family n=1 Tax=Sphingomonas jatrophae TaxID=1166337 RepID=A0A1I6JMR7_9SPHN|nr:DUF1810 domain-containing protein [Sphingomonas jatrophae]SFR80227.1 Uncharacterized protein, DUF1810 family [Sphingomonas jatrophae]
MAGLDRFVTAQDAIWPTPFEEIRAGTKRSHWMWFVFPQIAGLGRSETARFYAIADLEEARAYLAHPLLGERLRACVEALAALPRPDATHVFGSVDALKLRSSLTLFAEAGGGAAIEDALARWFDGPDEATLRLVRP